MQYKKGDILEVRITSYSKFGAKCEIGREKCFIPVKEFADYFIGDLQTFVQVGDLIKAEVLEYNRQRLCYLLSYKSIRQKREKELADSETTETEVKEPTPS